MAKIVPETWRAPARRRAYLYGLCALVNVVLLAGLVTGYIRFLERPPITGIGVLLWMALQALWFFPGEVLLAIIKINRVLGGKSRRQ